MDKKEETRRFESEMLALPPLKMYLVHPEPQGMEQPAKKITAAKKPHKHLDEIAAIVRLIDRLSEED